MSALPDVSTTNKPEYSQDEIDNILSGCPSRFAPPAKFPPSRINRPRAKSTVKASPARSDAKGPSNKPQPIDNVSPSDPPRLIIPSADFIGDYVEYADHFEIPRIMHEVVAMVGIAAVANGEVFINTGGTRIPLDLWVMVLTRSGGGKNTLVQPFRNLLKQAGLEGLVQRESFGSSSFMEEHFSKNPRGLLVYEEMAYFLAQLKQRHFLGAQEWLTNCYDELSPPNAKHYRSRRKPEEQTPEIVYEEAPRICFLAMSAEAWFFKNAESEQATGGFLARWMPMWVKDLERCIPRPRPENSELLPPLIEKLKHIGKLSGDMDISEVGEMYDRWYEETKRRFDSHSNPALVRPFWGRHRNHLWKVAAIYELSSSGGLKIRPESMKKAIKTCAELEQNVYELVRSSFSSEGVKAQNFEKYILDAGLGGRSQREVYEYLSDLTRQKAEERVEMLVMRELVVWFKRPTAGRPAHLLVHSTHSDQHAKDYPKDQLKLPPDWGTRGRAG